MKRLLVFVFAVALLGSCSSVSKDQENKYEVLIENSCGFDKDVINKKVYAFASDIDADNALEKIMKLTGLPPNFEIKSANVDNACAVVECDDEGGCKRLIYYNQEFLEKMNDATNTEFTELAILAHEIGHHLSGHTIVKSKNRHQEELEADKFAGFILHQLGASLETTKKILSKTPKKGSQTHPPRDARIAAISSGWYDSKRKANNPEKKEENIIVDSRDGKEYKTVKIGEQVWMAENLAYKPSSGNYWAYDNDYTNVVKYGYLYDLEIAKEVCPTGWHLPSDNEWSVLIEYLGGGDILQLLR